MKTWFLCGAAIAFVALSGCSKKDTAYYQEHIDDAKAKKSECEASMAKAFMAQDEKKVNEIDADVECNAAEKALQNYREQQRKLAEEKAKAEQEKKIAEEKEKIQKELGDADWKAIATQYAGSECAKAYRISSNDYHCLAFADIYNKHAEAAIKTLLQQPFTTLSTQQDAYCTRDQRNYSPCAIWMSALKKSAEKYFSAQDFPTLDKLGKTYGNYNSLVNSEYAKVFNEGEKKIIEGYVKDYDALKSTWNKCVTDYQNAKNWKVRDAIASDYPCRQAEKARNELELPYNHFETLME